MATRVAARFAPRRLFSNGSGRVLSEEEKAAENVYIKVIMKLLAGVLSSQHGWFVSC